MLGKKRDINERTVKSKNIFLTCEIMNSKQEKKKGKNRLN